jgi:V8-like Glu-specific endopeptidase
MFRFFGSVLFISFVAGSHALALPILAKPPSIQALSPLFTSNYDFEGIVALDNCSGSLVRFASSLPSDQAMVLTNGHCVESGFPSPGTIVVGQASSRSFELFKADRTVSATLTADKILYATMTGTDVALYRTQETYAQVKESAGVRPFDLLASHPVAGSAIEVISGYWQRGYSCAIDGFVNEIKESQWTWKDSIRYTSPGCEVIGGTSGSPILLGGSRVVVGINNTTNEDGARCTLNNPCEVDAAGNVSFKKGAAYGEETYWIASCVGASRDIDLALPGCLLPKGGN